MVNAKITVPIDYNYFDDELTFFPYYLWLVLAQGTNTTEFLPAIQAALDSMARTHAVVADYRSDMWDLIYATGMAKWYPDEASTFIDEVVDSVVWNLQTWPLELVSWHVHNSHRQDIALEQYYTPQCGGGGSDYCSYTLITANERYPDRWNSDPFMLDIGDGMLEWDATSWLMPYWQARAHGIILPSDVGV